MLSLININVRIRLDDFLPDLRALFIDNNAGPRLIDTLDEVIEIVSEFNNNSTLYDKVDELEEELMKIESMISASYEETGICVCGKVEADGIRCRFGATHRPRTQPRHARRKYRPAEVPPVHENKACFPWEPKS